jgi:hypothetical protein
MKLTTNGRVLRLSEMTIFARQPRELEIAGRSQSYELPM